MNEPREQALPSTGVTGQQHGDVGLRRAFGQRQHLRHRRAVAHDGEVGCRRRVGCHRDAVDHGRGWETVKEELDRFQVKSLGGPSNGRFLPRMLVTGRLAVKCHLPRCLKVARAAI